MKTPKKFKNIKLSGTFEFFALMKKMMREGRDIMPLVAGELAAGTPDDIAQAGIDAIHAGHTKYTINKGLIALREQIAIKYKTECGIDYEVDNIIVSTGAKQTIYNSVQATCEAGDEVIIFTPYFPSYSEIIKLAGATPVLVPLSFDNRFQIDKEQLEKYITPATRMIILNTPTNPTGAVLNKESLEAVNEVVLQNDIYLLTDEIYEKIIFDPAKHISPICLNHDLKDKTIIVNGFSKSYSMTGWRIGYALAPKDLIERCAIIQSHSTSNSPTIAQHAAIQALKSGDDFINKQREILKENRDLVTAELSKWRNSNLFVPEGAFYYFFDINCCFNDKVKNSTEMAIYLLEEHDVALVPGVSFGTDNFLRLSFAVDRNHLSEGLKRLLTGLKQINA